MKQLPVVEITGPHQTRPADWPAAYTAFADELEAALAAGADELETIAAALNARGSASPAGAPWTAQSLRARLAELGA
jgi:hypothetical protein